MHDKVWEAKGEVKVADWIVVMELTFGGCLQDSHAVGLEVTITDERALCCNGGLPTIR